MGLLIRFAIAFAVLGLLISAIAGLIGGNRVTPLVVTAVVCSLVAGGAGIGSYIVLEKRVPEVFELFAGGAASSASSDDELSLGGDEEGELDLGEETPAMASAANEASSGKFGDHIIVDKIKIKNEPKLMAEAIKTMLAKDSA
ncbi:MAG: hypothetical protein K1X75_01100 [Leptospirales bacterium]|nr:hypothetical protein [Leptospirales bacterium]